MTIADAQIEPSSDEAALLDYLRARDVACPLCAYNLRGLTASRCPECGREIRLSVGLVEPRIGAWVTCLVAVTIASGMGLFVVLSTIPRGLGALFVENAVQGLVIGYFLVSLLIVPALIVFRQRYRRLSQRRQWALAGFAAGSTALAYTLVFAWW